MVNLLPQTERKRNRREYLLRFLSVVLVSVALILFIGAVLLLPAFFAISSQKEIVKEELRIAEASIASRTEGDAVDILVAANKKVKFLARPESVVGGLLEDILDEKPNAVILSDLFFDLEGRGTIKISGVSEEREDLIQFQKNLERIDEIQDVVLPIGSLASNEDIVFSVTGTISDL